MRRSLSLARIFAASVILALWSGAAQALLLSVDGSLYEITFTVGSYSAVDGGANGPLNATPWFGDSGLGFDFANALKAADDPGNTVFPAEDVFYMFAYAPTASIYYSNPSAATNAGNVSSISGGTTANTSFGSTNYSFASATLVTVPEIDGNALAKALFILFALGVWLDVRRRRTAG